jgi:hypothetical protein
MQRRSHDLEGLMHLDWVNEDLPRLGHENLIRALPAEHSVGRRWSASRGRCRHAFHYRLACLNQSNWRVPNRFGGDGRSVRERADDFFGGTSCDYFVKVRDTGEDDDPRAVCKEAGFISFG